MTQMNVATQRVSMASAVTRLYRQAQLLFRLSLMAQSVRQTRADDVEGARKLADQQLQAAPRFAQELYAAANRHERTA